MPQNKPAICQGRKVEVVCSHPSTLEMTGEMNVVHRLPRKGVAQGFFSIENTGMSLGVCGGDLWNERVCSNGEAWAA